MADSLESDRSCLWTSEPQVFVPQQQQQQEQDQGQDQDQDKQELKGEVSASECTSTSFDLILLQPHLIMLLDFQSLTKLSYVNRHCRQALLNDSQTIGCYWQAMCNALCAHAGLFSALILQPNTVIPQFQYRRYFFDQLWPLRKKWTSALSTDEKPVDDPSLSYRVTVSCRFRPGERPEGKVCLPLHQFLRVKRQMKQQEQKNTGVTGPSTLLIGERTPDEFIDPILGTVMKDPVLLTSSNCIVDRSLAVQCLLRGGGRDPFTNEKLTSDMLVPQTDLQTRIREWQLRKQGKSINDEVSVDLKDVRQSGLVEDQAVNEELLDALMHIERMQGALQRAKLCALHDEDLLNGHRHSLGEEAAESDTAVDPVLFNPETVQSEPFLSLDENAEQLNHERLDRHAEGSTMRSDVEVKQQQKQETARVVDVNNNAHSVSVHVPGSGVRAFHFSKVLPKHTQQEAVYELTTSDSVTAALNGCNSCVLCYGQTGSGKTFTFLGPEGILDVQKPHSPLELDHNSGFALRSAAKLFEAKDAMMRRGVDISLGLQVVEIYEEKVTDLLTGNTCSVRRDNGHVVGASEARCHSFDDVLVQLRSAHSRQRFAETAMNARSSRAHTVLIFHIRQQVPVSALGVLLSQAEAHGSTKLEPKTLLVESQLHLVDLAGSERVKKSQVEGQRLREAVGINSSLLVLGKVISALSKGHGHVPYLECKLTTLLKAAFGGNARTMVIVNARIEETHGDETLQSLRFAERCSTISNTLRQKACSLESTLHSMDAALVSMDNQLKALAARDKQHLDAYQTLLSSFQLLQSKRQQLSTSRSACQ